jgi:Ca2+-binding RTX toxin-like protein
VLVDAAPQLSPDNVAGRDITILDHSATIQDTRTDLYGNDYIAGNAGDDVIFGQLGNDTIQGDGSTDSWFTGGAVGASRTPAAGDPLGGLTLTPSFDAAGDGNDYVEGGGGNDVIFGNQGQDDLIGGSSSLFGLGTASRADSGLRPDGSDYVFGGSGTAVSLDNPGGPNGSDSDAIVGDNGNIFRIVTSAGAYAKFTYDTYAGPKIVVRALQLLDYTPGGPDYNGTTDGGLHATGSDGKRDIGAADEIHGENGDDFIYGQVGNDRLFGDGQNDTIVGGYGADWISGGTGDDGILGDDGRILASRVGQTEPMNGVTVVPPLNVEVSIQGGAQDVMTNVTGTLLYTADLQPDNLDPSNAAPYTLMPRPLYANDVIYGGLGNDSIHGGAGDDAISGAEALAVSYTNNYNQDGTLQAAFLRSDFDHPYNPGNVLGYSPASTYQAQYDPTDPLREVKLTATGALWKSGTGFDWLLNFDSTRGPVDTYWATSGGVATDGNDIIFGDLGNDWAVGGTGRDTMWGGWGNDYLNADDVLTTNAGLNDATDTNASYEDFAYGGAGVDVLIANTGGDRLIDWSGEWDSYLVPFSPFGMATVSRNPSPGLQDLLIAFAKSQGADQTLTTHGGTAARDGEPFGELGMVTSADAAWGDQHGSPRDPQPGNSHGSRDVLRTSGTKLIGSGTAATASVAPSAAAPFAAPTPTAPTAPATPPVVAPLVVAPNAFASIDPTIAAPGYVNLANRAAVTITLGGPVGATITYKLTDGARSVGGMVLIGASGSAIVSVDASTLADGTLTVNAFYLDINGYSAGATATVRKDTAPPTVSASLQAPPATNSGWYDVGSKISLSVSGSDGISATLDGNAISSGMIDLDTLTAGAHTIVVRGFDTAGNLTTQTITFQVRATLAGLMAAVNDGFAKGFITAAEQTTLVNLLRQAMNGNSGRVKLPAFTAEVQLQSGKAIASGYAALLLNWAADLQSRL